MQASQGITKLPTKASGKTKFTKATKKNVMGSSFTGYLMTTYKHLVKCLGEPQDRTEGGPWRSGDEKTRVEWAFKARGGKEATVITIYDYKEIVPIEKVTTWHVSSMGEPELIERFFIEKGLSKKARPLIQGLIF